MSSLAEKMQEESPEVEKMKAKRSKLVHEKLEEEEAKGRKLAHEAASIQEDDQYRFDSIPKQVPFWNDAIQEHTRPKIEKNILAEVEVEEEKSKSRELIDESTSFQEDDQRSNLSHEEVSFVTDAIQEQNKNKMPIITEKKQNEILEAEEEMVKTSKLVHVSGSIQSDDEYKSDLIHEQIPTETDMDKFFASDHHLENQNMKADLVSDIEGLISSIKEDREKNPLPKDFPNFLLIADGGNRMLRFEDIGAEATRTWTLFPQFLPGGLRGHVKYSFVYSYGSKIDGFVAFECYEIASWFLEEYNGKEIPGTSLSYKLRWAPFAFHHLCNYIYFDDLIEAAEEKWCHAPTGNSETNEERFLEVANALKKFHISCEEKVHQEKKDPRSSWKLLCPSVFPGEDDGVTKILYLHLVDPVISKLAMEHIFGKFGECSVYLPPGKGCGHVRFNERLSAERAMKCLAKDFSSHVICDMYWGIEYEEVDDVLHDYYGKDSPWPCCILGPWCTQMEQTPQLVEDLRFLEDMVTL